MRLVSQMLVNPARADQASASKAWLAKMVWCFLFFGMPPQAGAELLADDGWPEIQASFFADKVVANGQHLIQITTPAMAEDATMVPISVTTLAAAAYTPPIKKAYLITDANPVQLTATLHFHAPVAPMQWSTRIRLEKSTFVRVVIETEGEQYWMHKVFIKTPGGGCGGGLSSDEAQLRAEAGKMRAQLAAPLKAGEVNTLSLNLRHPMRTGFERTVYGYYAKPYFIHHLALMENQRPIISIDVGVGISANPYFRLNFMSSISEHVYIHAADNEGNQYQQALMPGADF